MKRFLLVAAMLLAGIASANAQAATVVTTCGTLPQAYAAGSARAPTQDTNGNGCVAASVSASITGFAPATTGTPISVTTGGVTGTLPAGAVVVASNVGATNGAYCKLGASATISDQLIPPNSWFAFTVGASTQLTCITSTSTTTVNMVGGAGLPTGSGGGGGSGALTNYALETGGNLASILSAVQGAIPAGTNTIGTVGQLPYPVGATPITASATGTTAATAATLAKASSVTTYICGFSIRANATAAATANSTVAGTITGTLNFTQWTAPLASGIGITEMVFNPCVPSSTTNTDIVVTSAAPGSGGVVSVSAWGYRL